MEPDEQADAVSTETKARSLLDIDRTWLVRVAGLFALLLLSLLLVTRWAGGGFEVTGSVTSYSHGYGAATMGECAPGYGISKHGPVKVSVDGETVGLGKLDDGEPSEDRCVMRFVVEDVEDGHDFYSITIGDKPAMEYTRAELSAPLDLVAE